MGYNTITVAPGATVAMGVQFETVDQKEIPIKNLVSIPLADQKYGASTSKSDAGDNIWVYNGASWTKYYAYKGKGMTSGRWCVVGDTTYAEIPDTLTLKAGQSFFFVRPSTATSNVDITLSGGVKALNTPLEYSIAPGATVAMTFPWPVAMKVKEFGKYMVAADRKYGASTSKSDAGDNIWVYNGASWTKYYAYKGKGMTDGRWCVVGDTTYEEIGDNIVINPGQGFYFVRPSTATANTTITFSLDK